MQPNASNASSSTLKPNQHWIQRAWQPSSHTNEATDSLRDTWRSFNAYLRDDVLSVFWPPPFFSVNCFALPFLKQLKRSPVFHTQLVQTCQLVRESSRAGIYGAELDFPPPPCLGSKFVSKADLPILSCPYTRRAAVQ